jgi:NO-binding membrane sensor protein with MHYT domain
MVNMAQDHVHHFDMGGWLMFLAYVTSVVGSTVGLACTLQSRYAVSPRSRMVWLSLAAISIGGVGIWVMHFIAMLGFATPGLPVRYEIGATVLSAVLSIGAVFVGLLVFGVRAKFAPWRLFAGGLIMGLAVNLMHYTGMWAVQVKGTIGYDVGLVLLSIVIAVVAATAALWFTVATDRLSLRILAGVIMGVAVTGMHYTGMAAVEVHLDAGAPDPSGVEVFSFLFPVFVLAAIALAVPVSAALMASSPTEKEPVLLNSGKAAPIAFGDSGLRSG